MVDKCSYCGITEDEADLVDDHILAESRGGVTTTKACTDCNSCKQAKTVLQWFRWLKIKDHLLWEEILDYQYGRRGKFAKIAHKVRDESLEKSIQLYRFY